MTPNLQVRGVGGRVLWIIWEKNLEQQLNSEKRLGELQMGNSRFPILQAQTQAGEQVPDLWSPPGAACPLLRAPCQGGMGWAT